MTLYRITLIAVFIAWSALGVGTYLYLTDVEQRLAEDARI